jgi:hypothetical protein
VRSDDGGTEIGTENPEPPSEPPSRPGADPVEQALATALTAAAAAGRFDVVAQLARELEARRLARAGNVVQLGVIDHDTPEFAVASSDRNDTTTCRSEQTLRNLDPPALKLRGDAHGGTEQTVFSSTRSTSRAPYRLYRVPMQTNSRPLSG